MPVSKLQPLRIEQPPPDAKPHRRKRGSLIVMPLRATTSCEDLASRVKQQQPGAFEELFDLVLEIASDYGGSNSGERPIEERVNDLMTIALEAVFAGVLSRPGALPDLIRTLARLPDTPASITPRSA
jgi:hypothetical protein